MSAPRASSITFGSEPGCGRHPGNNGRPPGDKLSPFIKLSRRGKTVLFVDRTASAVVPTFLRNTQPRLRGAFFPPLNFLRREPPPSQSLKESPGCAGG